MLSPGQNEAQSSRYGHTLLPMIFKSSEQRIYERIREEIRSRLASSQVPGEVESFLLQRWSGLLREIYLGRGGDHPDWQAGWDTVDALLWSLTPKKNRQETERLLRLLPILLGRLQEGCQAMGVPEAETDVLFALLAKLHAALARAGLDAAPTGESQLPPVRGVSQDADIAHAPSAKVHVPAEVEPSGEKRAVAGEPSLEGLQAGDWVTFRFAEGEKRMRLQWVSASGAMFLFADNQGLDALSLTRPRLLQRLARGELALG